MDRRSFLRTLTGGLAATAALAVVDPDELLWKPGTKSFFFPPEQKLLQASFVGFSQAQHGGAPFIVAGDILTIEGVYATSPFTNRTVPHLQQFVVTRSVDNAMLGKNLNPIELMPAPPKGTRIQIDKLTLNLTGSRQLSGDHRRPHHRSR